MRISDQERREVAHELREMVGARCYGRPGATGSCVDIDDFLTALLNRRVRDCEVSIDSVEALRVADLIDAPTSEGIIDDNGTSVCGRCGFRFDASVEIAGCFSEVVLANHCPKCGRLLVWREEEDE